MWQFILFYLSNHHYVYSASGIASYHIPPWSIVSDLSLAGFLNTLLEVFSHRTTLYTNHLPVSPSWGFPEKEQKLCNGFPKHQQSLLDTAKISLFPSLWTKLQLRSQLIAARSSHHCHSSSPYDFHQQLPTFNTQIVRYKSTQVHFPNYPEMHRQRILFFWANSWRLSSVAMVRMWYTCCHKKWPSTVWI